ncbi:hypothetical protein IFM89_023621, partial [Coptis chinensis]
YVEGKRVTDFSLNEETGCISKVICGEERFDADAVILAVGVSTLQHIIKSSSALRRREEFLKILNMTRIAA